MKQVVIKNVLLPSFLLFSFIFHGQSTDISHNTVHGLAYHSDTAHQHEKTTQKTKNAKLVTGQGEFVFSFDENLTNAFPTAAREFEPKMHGGFNEDPETGIVYTGIPGYGLCTISPDLTKWQTIGDDERLKDNIHGIVFFVHKGEKFLAVAQEGKRVLVLTIEGKVVSEILKPLGTEFTFEPANTFFASADSNFGVTDVTYLNGLLYVAHGYSKGDFVLSIKEENGVWSWNDLAWGGKGDTPGQFRTAHGVFAYKHHVYVANRAAGQVVKFTQNGDYVGTFDDIPEGSLICNIGYKRSHFFLNALKPIGAQKSAPIYAHTGSKLVSTIIPGDLNIPVLTNIHQVWPHVVSVGGKEQLFLLVHGWNKGKYAVLKLEN